MKAVPPSRILVFSLIAAIGCGLDLWTKTVMFNWFGMPGKPPFWIVPDVFGFQTSLNQGALFGIGQGYTPLFAALAVAAAVGVLAWLLFYGAAEDWLLTIALGSIEAGILGNLYDRLGWPGLVWPAGYPEAGQSVYAVRDWVLVMIGDWPWPTFNIADSMLVVGASLLMWHSLWCDRENGTDAASAEVASPDGT
ncbi:MAG: signal peptidase II [Patescibacteria group bacterium]|nr:signal peptidase II [Patescibacteria group bacterium]